MAATIATDTGYDKSRSKETHRLGSESAVAEAATWQTFATVMVRRDGSGTFELRGANRSIIAEVAWPAESDARDQDMRAAVVAAREASR